MLLYQSQQSERGHYSATCLPVPAVGSSDLPELVGVILEVVNQTRKELADTLETSLVLDEKPLGKVGEGVPYEVELITSEIGGTISGYREGQPLGSDREEVHVGDTRGNSAGQEDRLGVALGELLEGRQRLFGHIDTFDPLQFLQETRHGLDDNRLGSGDGLKEIAYATGCRQHLKIG